MSLIIENERLRKMIDAIKPSDPHDPVGVSATGEVVTRVKTTFIPASFLKELQVPFESKELSPFCALAFHGEELVAVYLLPEEIREGRRFPENNRWLERDQKTVEYLLEQGILQPLSAA